MFRRRIVPLLGDKAEKSQDRSNPWSILLAKGKLNAVTYFTKGGLRSGSFLNWDRLQHPHNQLLPLVKGWYLFIFNLMPTPWKRILEAEPDLKFLSLLEAWLDGRIQVFPTQKPSDKRQVRKLVECGSRWQLGKHGKPFPRLQQLCIKGSQGITSTLITVSRLDSCTLMLFLHLTIATFILLKLKMMMLGSLVSSWSWGCSIKDFPGMTAKIWEESEKQKVVLSGRSHGRIDRWPHVTTVAADYNSANHKSLFSLCILKVFRVDRNISRKKQQQFSPGTQ